MSLVEYIPVVINKDSDLAFAIFECEICFITIMARNISKKCQEKEERKRRSVWMRPYLTQYASERHYNS